MRQLGRRINWRDDLQQEERGAILIGAIAPDERPRTLWRAAAAADEWGTVQAMLVGVEAWPAQLNPGSQGPLRILCAV